MTTSSPAWPYPWLTTAYQQLQAFYHNKTAHHALLAQLLPGYGAEQLLPRLASGLLCQQPLEQHACGHCHSCRLLQAGHHPDWHVLQVEEGKQQISVEAVRQLINSLQQHAWQSGGKVIHIVEAERLTEAAANALLKTLEEPTAHCYFLLSSYQPARLLSTLRSRCLHWRFIAPSLAQSMDWLMQQQPNIDSQQARAALQLSQQAPLLAAALLTTPQWQWRLQLLTQLATALTKRQLQPLLALCQQAEPQQALNWLYSVLVDSRKWQQQLPDWLVNDDQQPLIAQLAQQMSAEDIVAIQQQLMDCLNLLQRPIAINQPLMLANFLIEWQRHLLPFKA